MGRFRVYCGIAMIIIYTGFLFCFLFFLTGMDIRRTGV